jgi:protein-disulfide isomerase
VSTARQIDETYVKTGQVRIVAKNMPVHGAPAQKAAEAALCASDQGRFWEYHDSLMESLYAGTPTAYSVDSLKQVAASLGLDTAAFAACLDGNKYSQRVQNEAAEAKKLGVTGTPTFFVNGTKIVGAKPFETFKAAIDRALAAP